MTCIYYEESIPNGDAYFSSLGTAIPFQGASLQPEQLKNVDYLAVRSTTTVDATLLSHANKLKLVTTATAGTNHMDLSVLASLNIPWSSAGGCNAVSVAEYVISVLMNGYRQKELDLDRITVGIVGAGHVGTALSHRLQALNIAYKLCDPPLQEQGDSRHFVSMDEILTCDVVTLHVPFVKSGPHATGHLIDKAALATLTGKQILINACRGEVIDQDALLDCLMAKQGPTTVLDVFANEPQINQALLPHLWMATPHIAGHSIEGKLRGTQMAYEHICYTMNCPVKLSMEDFLPQPPAARFAPEKPSAEGLDWDTLSTLLLGGYDISKDNTLFQADTSKSGFLAMRKHYPQRRECSAYVLRMVAPISEGITSQLSGLGFTLELI
ncbi:4-phosphoerythronate dehydrogenase [Alteromonas sp. C1M14]|uniref:4-phosphoerythronate dehydrogenase n=1 Tax=Alteromonas sp. C1M14 TaxID=2841567 RepID=UPI001C094595|nr:4-phosphoerythronate dehydrogenase [Alteromonas sp. C1M14]MBU2979746.1 4-phosphoerythronate dehydrogenase [Alteromonas sp. C1M14]